LEFRVLGTGSANPQLGVHPSAFVLTIENHLLLIDCGEGTQYQLLKYKIKPTRIKYILISHLHGDHYFGLIGLICSFNLNHRTEPLTVIGPEGLEEIILAQLKYAQSKLSFELTFLLTNPLNTENVLIESTFTVFSFPLKHRIPCTGFLITKTAPPRKVLADLLPANFAPVYYKLLKEGQDVYDELGQKWYKNSEYTQAMGPKTFAYCSDTIFDADLPKYFPNVDLLYHEATFSEEQVDRATFTFHSTAGQAAEIAKMAKAKQLIIGHFSSRYQSYSHFLKESEAIFQPTMLAEEGLNYII
jgi:ribonuclease Z